MANNENNTCQKILLPTLHCPNLEWNTSFEVLKNYTKYIQRNNNMILLVKLIQLEFDETKKSTRVVENSIHQADVKIDEDNVTWSIVDQSDLSEPLTIEVPLNNGKTKEDSLGYFSERDDESSTEDHYISYGVITAFAIVDLNTCKSNYDLILKDRYDPITIRVFMDSKEEADKAAEIIRTLGSKFSNSMGLADIYTEKSQN